MIFNWLYVFFNRIRLLTTNKECSVRVMCSVCRVFCLQPMLCVNFRLRRLQRRQLRCYVQLVPRLFFVVNAVC